MFGISVSTDENVKKVGGGGRGTSKHNCLVSYLLC